MKRILIIGSAGAGKSTLARALGHRLHLPVIHLDTQYWQPGWVEPDKGIWRRRVAELVQKDTWIMDGNYGDTMEMRLAAADTVIFLDFPRWLCLGRIVKRRLQYAGRTRPDMGPGCTEKIDWAFWRWVWNYPVRSRPAIQRRLRGVGRETKVIVLTGPAQVRGFQEKLHQAATSDGQDTGSTGTT